MAIRLRKETKPMRFPKRLPKMIALLCFATLFFLPVAFTKAVEPQVVEVQSATEAPTGFDNQSNGLIPQGQFDADKAIFDEHEGISDGLGPVYNAQSCGECHQSPVSGGVSQIAELRAGHFD